MIIKAKNIEKYGGQKAQVLDVFATNRQGKIHFACRFADGQRMLLAYPDQVEITCKDTIKVRYLTGGNPKERKDKKCTTTQNVK